MSGTALSVIANHSAKNEHASAVKGKVDELLERYEGTVGTLREFHSMMHDGSYSWCISTFHRAQGNATTATPSFGDIDKAIKVVDADFWRDALNVTGALEIMPATRRDEWLKGIEKLDVPVFEEGSVRSTLTDILLSLDKYFAERVDGVFQALSGTHVTNEPQGFGKRMILAGVSKDGSLEYRAVDIIHDARWAICGVLGAAKPNRQVTRSALSSAMRDPGQWVSLDGGRLRVKMFKKGTAHLEVHPQVAWRLNEVLATLYPAAIPPKFRKRPAFKDKGWVLHDNPVSEEVLCVLAGAQPGLVRFLPEHVGGDRAYKRSDSMFTFSGVDPLSPSAMSELKQVVAQIGGRVEQVTSTYLKLHFDYNAGLVIDQVVYSGVVPDKVSAQFYPTEGALSESLVQWCDIEEGHRCLEPSAGQGGIAEHMPQSTVCVEATKVNAAILRAKGFKNVIQEDFLYWVKSAPRFDRIVMNPPFQGGRAEAHLRAAVSLLDLGGIVTAILPASMKSAIEIKGCSIEWGSMVEQGFAGTAVRVVSVKIKREYFE